MTLIAALAGLQVMPENLTHILRLERAVQLSAAFCPVSAVRGAYGPSDRELRDRLASAQELQILELDEDPAEGLFLENVAFIGGSFLVYPGISSSSPYVLRHLLRASLVSPWDSFPKEFLGAAYGAAAPLLVLSNEIASRLGHLRWAEGEPSASSELYVPPSDALERAAEAVTFTTAELEQLLSDVASPEHALGPYIADPGDLASLRGAHPDQHPLGRCPVVQDGDTYVVAQPCSLANAIRHRIVVLAKEQGVLDVLMQRYRRSIWRATLESLRLMHYRPEPVELPHWPDGADVEEEVLRFDQDKLCYVQLIVDPASEYDSDTCFGMWRDDNLGGVLDARRREAVKFLSEQTDTQRAKCLCLAVFQGIGRYSTVACSDEGGAGSRLIVCTSDDLEAVARQRDADQLTLWKFASARDALETSTELRFFSFLDAYALYREHDGSFVINDDAPPTHMSIVPGLGRDLRARAARLWDVHNARYGDGERLQEVATRYDDEIPIYIPVSLSWPRSEYLVEGYSQPLWVHPSTDSGPLPAGLVDLNFHMTETLAYWLWQLSSRLSVLLLPLGEDPVTVIFEFDEPGTWVSPPVSSEQPVNSAPPSGFSSASVEMRSVRLCLPASLLHGIGRADNEGERTILAELLRGFSSLLLETGCEKGIADETITRILEECAPLGLKKKFLLVDGGWHPQLAKDNLPDLRRIQEHDVSAQLDGLVDEVNSRLERPLSVGPVPEERYKDLIDATLKAHLAHLRSRLSRFAQSKVLEVLVSQNEAVTRQLAFMKLTGPTSAACFRDTERQATLQTKGLEKLHETALALRFLIEFAAAEPPSGSGSPSLAEVDELLAAALGYVNWAMRGDEIRCHVIRHTLSVLPNGRLGVGLAGREERRVLWEFLEARNLEGLEDDTEDFASDWFSTPGLQSDDEVHERPADAALKAEFGLTSSELAALSRAVISLGFESDGAAASRPVADFVDCVAELSGLPHELVHASLEEFSLRGRAVWDSVPEGFSVTDIQPNRYCRKLSFMMRPLIQYPNPESPEQLSVMWGPRHYFRAMRNLVSLVTSGRYRPEQAKSEEMKAYRGEVIRKRGAAFEESFFAWCEDLEEVSLRKRLRIGPGQSLEADQDLGDVDALLLDAKNMRVYCVECKAIDCGRTPVEMSQEIASFCGDSRRPDELSIADRHIRRVDWLDMNWGEVASVTGFPAGVERLVPVLVVSQEIPTAHLRRSTIPLPVLPLQSLKREGLQALERVADGDHVRVLSNRQQAESAAERFTA